jgi:hypothetical protein
VRSQWFTMLIIIRLHLTTDTNPNPTIYMYVIWEAYSQGFHRLGFLMSLGVGLSLTNDKVWSCHGLKVKDPTSILLKWRKELIQVKVFSGVADHDSGRPYR